MPNAVTRLFILSGLVLAGHFVAQLLHLSLKPPQVSFRGRLLEEFANNPLEELPLQIGSWQGEATQIDDRLRGAINAEFVADRRYRNDEGGSATLHTALFSAYDQAVSHNPKVCYKGAGWELVEETELTLQTVDQESLSVALLTYRRQGEVAKIAYWYQLGDHVFFNRGGLGTARFDLLGKEVWPALIKVLLHIPATGDSNRDKKQMRSLAEPIYQWFNPDRGAEPKPSGDAA